LCDVQIDRRFGQSQILDRRGQMFDPEHYLELYEEPGGAALLGRLIKEVLAESGLGHAVAAPDWNKVLERDKITPYWHTYSVCSQVPRSERGDEDGKAVWRIARKLGIDRIDPREKLDPEPPDDSG